MDSVTNLNGKTFRVGQLVHYRGIPCTIRMIRPVLRGVPQILVDFTAENLERVPDSERWMLNPQAAEYHGRPDYCRPRDHGVSMGCFDEAE
jgi:hypothetical protein